MMKPPHSEKGTLVGKDDCALVIRKDGVELLLPSLPDDEVVPANVQIATALMVRLLKEPSFAKEQMEWLRNDMDRHDEETKLPN